jgi:hypothetical protein
VETAKRSVDRVTLAERLVPKRKVLSQAVAYGYRVSGPLDYVLLSTTKIHGHNWGSNSNTQTRIQICISAFLKGPAVLAFHQFDYMHVGMCVAFKYAQQTGL